MYLPLICGFYEEFIEVGFPTSLSTCTFFSNFYTCKCMTGRHREYKSLMAIKSVRLVVSQIKIPRAVTQQPFLGCCCSEVIWWRSPLPFEFGPLGRQNFLSMCRTQGGNCTPASAGEMRPRVRVAPAWHRQGEHSQIYPFISEQPQQWHPSSFLHTLSLLPSSPSVFKCPLC